MMTFITRRKRQRVKIVIGKVIRIRKGLIRLFEMASTRATTIAVQKLSTCAPGSSQQVIATIKAYMSQPIIRNFIVFPFLFRLKELYDIKV